MRINPYAPSEEVFNNTFGNVLNSNKVQANNITNNIVDNDDNKASFADTLKASLDDINSQQVKADNLTDSFVRGDENVDIADVMLSTAEANTSLQYAVQVRNKLVDAYQEITKMQI